MMIKHFALTVLIITINLIITGCAATTVNVYRVGEEKTLCDEKGKNLGYVAILPEVAWRKDQKEPEKRKQMALEEIERSFQQFPCGTLSAPGGIRSFADWSGKPESALLKNLATEGVDTVILIRIEELSPRLYVTFSLPFLWGGTSEADFRIRALSVESGSVLTDMRVKRFRGGPFNIRPAEWARKEFSAALDEIFRTAVSD